jgi:hypothetical protein
MSTTTEAAPKKSKSKYAAVGYSGIRHLTEQPINSRPALAIGRGGEKIKPRRFHLEGNKLDALRNEYKESGKIPSPFNEGMYNAIFLGLLDLGINSKHKFASLEANIKERLSATETKDENGKTAWQRFRDKEAGGSEETSLDAHDRLLQNCKVLQRLGGKTPYGLKLNEVGTKVIKSKGLVIDLLKSGTGEVYVRLNSESNKPINELLVRQPVAPKRVAKPAKKRKAAKAVAATTSEPTAKAADDATPTGEVTGA